MSIVKPLRNTDSVRLFVNLLVFAGLTAIDMIIMLR